MKIEVKVEKLVSITLNRKELNELIDGIEQLTPVQTPTVLEKLRMDLRNTAAELLAWQLTKEAVETVRIT